MIDSTDARVRGGAVRRFWLVGLCDANRRLSRLTERVPIHDSQMRAVVRSSAVISTADRAFAWLWRTMEASALHDLVERLGRDWRQSDARARRAGAGGTLMIAAVVHLSLEWSQGGEPGWLWIVPPVVAALAGMLLIGSAIGTR